MSSSVRGAGGGGPSAAEKVSYNNTASGLAAENVQAAIDELETEKAKTSHASQHAAEGSDPITPESIGAAPAYTYGTEDLTAGTSPLETGKLYFVYE